MCCAQQQSSKFCFASSGGGRGQPHIMHQMALSSMAPPGRLDTDTAKLQLALLDSKRRRPGGGYVSSDSEDGAGEELPAGPVFAETCTVGGPGFAGGSANAAVTFRLQARDARGTQIREGGCYVTARVYPATAQAGEADVVPVEVQDNEDGTYSGTYTVPRRGDYELAVEINAEPVGGSPFPLYFSNPGIAPSEAVIAAGEAGSGAGRSGYPGLPQNVSREELALLASQGAGTFPQISVMGPRALNAKVDFPSDPAVIDKSILVGNISPAVTIEQLLQLFGFCGAVINARFTGTGERFAILEYGASYDAERALAMKGMQVVDRPIEVEGVRIARSASAGNDLPYGGLQLHQMAQVQLAQLQQQSLAAQVAQMRAQAKLNPGSMGAPGLPQNSASQKAAALTAIAALSKRLTGGASIAAFSDRASPPRFKRRREVSPTIRYRSDKSRDRSRERSRDRKRDRSRDRSRRRSRSPHRERERDAEFGKDKDKRARSRSPKRRSDRSPGRHRSSRRSPSAERRRSHRSRSRDRHRRRSSERGREHRDRDRGREHRDSKHSRHGEGEKAPSKASEPEAATDKPAAEEAEGEAGAPMASDSSRHRDSKRRHRKHRHKEEHEEQPDSGADPRPHGGSEARPQSGAELGTPEKEAQAAEEAELRSKALQSLRSGSAQAAVAANGGHPSGEAA